LNGFIFFGTAQGLLGRVRSRIADKSQPALRYLVLDFRRVSALDSSAVFSFIRIQQMADANGIHMFLTEVSQGILTTLKKGGVKMDTVQTFPSMDEAVGTCEDKIIKSEDSSAMGHAKLLNSRLKQAFSSKEQVDKFLHYLDRVELEAEQVLIRQGEQPAAMFFVEAGELAAILEIPPNKILRLRTMGPGSTVGEIGMYLRIPPTATVVASVKSVVHKLSVESLEKMEIENPALASGLHRWIVLTLSQRLSENNRTLEALLN
jgi:SulP family sulfate permease